MSADVFLQEALNGLSANQKTLPCKYFYDARGARLFEQICELPEYYPTRTEIGILKENADEMAELIGPRARMIEYGAGAGIKTQLLLGALHQPTAYVPIDISADQLHHTAQYLAGFFPALQVLPLAGDYLTELQLPEPTQPWASTVVFFPGSTIGNFSRTDAVNFLQRIRRLLKVGDGLLIGVDLKKPVPVLEAAYNDAAGVTADFNMNVLHRLNQELEANFDLQQFSHHAFYNPEVGAVEMHLVSDVEQQVAVQGQHFHFRMGETIHTENSHKYSLSEFAQLAAQAGFQRDHVWLDAQRLFSLQYFSPQEHA